MKCKVLKGFIDKETKKPYEVGADFECTEDRFKEIQSNGMYLSKVDEKNAKKGNKKPKKASMK